MLSTVISHSKDYLSQTETQSRYAKCVVNSQKNPRLATLIDEQSLPAEYIFQWLHYLIYQPHILLQNW